MKKEKLETITNLFEDSEEDYYFSVVDVIGALTNSNNHRKYWSVLKVRLKKEGSEVTTNCSQLKMLASDGKMRLRDAMSTKNILRLIESVPSLKAEPFKLWLANWVVKESVVTRNNELSYKYIDDNIQIENKSEK